MNRIRILLVDDHEDTLRVMKRLLEMEHAVSCAASFAEAMDLARRELFDLAIIDIQLPDGNGLNLMRQLRKMQAIPGIALTGLGMQQDLENSRDAGFCLHLTKPVTIEEVEEAILNCFPVPPRRPRAILS